MVYRYKVSASGYTEANVTNTLYWFVTSEDRWYMHIKFPASIVLYEKFYEGSTLTYNKKSYSVEYGKPL